MKPPSTLMIWPVTYEDASSSSRKPTALAISLGLPQRFIGTLCSQSSLPAAPCAFEAICLSRESGDIPYPASALKVGDHHPLAVGAGGVSMLAALPDDEVEIALAQASETIENDYPGVTIPIVRDLVRETRERGYCVLPGIIVKGYWGLSVPLLQKDGRPLAAIILVTSAERLTARRQAGGGAHAARCARFDGAGRASQRSEIDICLGRQFRFASGSAGRAILAGPAVRRQHVRTKVRWPANGQSAALSGTTKLPHQCRLSCRHRSSKSFTAEDCFWPRVCGNSLDGRLY